MPFRESLPIVNLTPVISVWDGSELYLSHFYSRWDWTGNLILGGT